MKKKSALIIGLILFAGISRLIPHPWNFTALGAMALFSGSMLNKKVEALIAPLLTLLWTDLILGFHETMIYVYVSVFLITLLGMWAQTSKFKVLTSGLLGSLLFFMTTNFGVWFSQNLYPKTLAGLMECYMMALPFFENQILGDFFYLAVLYGLYAVLARANFLVHRTNL